MSPCLRTPLYHLGPMRWILTSSKPACVVAEETFLPTTSCADVRCLCGQTLRAQCWEHQACDVVTMPRAAQRRRCHACLRGGTLVNQSRYSCSVGNSIQTSAKNLETGWVGCTGPIRHAVPPAKRKRAPSSRHRDRFMRLNRHSGAKEARKVHAAEVRARKGPSHHQA